MCKDQEKLWAMFQTYLRGRVENGAAEEWEGQGKGYRTSISAEWKRFADGHLASLKETLSTLPESRQHSFELLPSRAILKPCTDKYIKQIVSSIGKRGLMYVNEGGRRYVYHYPAELVYPC